MYRPARFVKNVRVVTFKDVNVEELARSDLEVPDTKEHEGERGVPSAPWGSSSPPEMGPLGTRAGSPPHPSTGQRQYGPRPSTERPFSFGVHRDSKRLAGPLRLRHGRRWRW